MPISKDNFKAALALLRGSGSQLALLLLVSVLQAVVFAILDPLALKHLIDAISSGDTRFFLILAAAVTAVATLGRGLIYWSSLLRQRLKNQLQRQISAEVTAVYYRHDLQSINHNGKGYYMARLHDEPKQLASLVDLCVSLVTGVVVALCGVAVAAWISWQVTLALVVIVPALYLLANRFSGKIGEVTNTLQESEAQFKSVLSTVIDSFKLVKLFDLNHSATQEVRRGLKAPLEASYQSVRYASMYRSLSAVFLSYAELSVIVVAGFQVITGAITIGALFGLTRAFSMVIQSVEQLSTILPRLATLNALLERYRSFKAEQLPTETLPEIGIGVINGQAAIATAVETGGELKVEIKAEVKGEPQPAAKGFALHQVGFGHGDHTILDQADLTIAPHSRVLISGPNGAGKSTFANLLAGFYRPDTGSIDGPQMSAMSASLYPFGMLPGNVAKTLSIVSAKYGTEARLAPLIKELGLSDCLESGYESLSEGQKKKCQIAVCLLKPAATYLFDEPLANIDDASKGRVLTLIDRFTQGASLMMIMHEGNRFTRMFDQSLTIDGRGGISLTPMPA
ncbi:ATP-binding cassette domain-containing protein [Ferrimonas kyonanensis]|uniref:ATP-binding cassette domain-containing protein n=1 Tax=Ferrimonas kyonanensis TaxID=364763 RepID=UPI00042733E9|nr:ABC transporter ATP-binding protein [Ferrimonas kyonanensis]